jgi:hypothetical protein
MLTKLLTALTAGFALGQWAASRQHQAFRNKLDNPRVKPHEVSSWEGEGGALPVTGAQLGPAPQVPSPP